MGKETVTAVILAAGAGTRMGGPKGLLAWPGNKGKELPLGMAHAEMRLASDSARVLVVTRLPMMKSLLRYVRPGIDLLASDAPDDLGPAGSLAFAVSRLGPAPEMVVVSPVDTPPAKPETVAALLARLAADPSLRAARPVYQSRAGHPVVLRRTALERYLQSNPPPLRVHLKALGVACADVEVADATVLIDLNTSADVMGCLQSLPRFVG